MFAAYKKNAAKRKAARIEHTRQFKARIAEINEKAELDKLSREAAHLVNKEKLKDKLAANNEMLKAAWRQ